MDFGEYDFDEIYGGDEINFRNFAILAYNGVEMEFRYKGENYFVINGPSALGKTDSYWFFGCGKGKNIKYSCRVCLFKEKEKLVEFLENFKIEGLTLKTIFDKKMSRYEEEDKENFIHLM